MSISPVPLHLPEDPVTPLLYVARRRRRGQAHRIRQHGGKHGGIAAAQAGGAFAEEVLRGGFCAISPVAEFGDVEIDLQNAPFRPEALDQEREIGLEPFSEVTAPGP